METFDTTITNVRQCFENLKGLHSVLRLLSTRHPYTWWIEFCKSSGKVWSISDRFYSRLSLIASSASESPVCRLEYFISTWHFVCQFCLCFSIVVCRKILCLLVYPTVWSTIKLVFRISRSWNLVSLWTRSSNSVLGAFWFRPTKYKCTLIYFYQSCCRYREKNQG